MGRGEASKAVAWWGYRHALRKRFKLGFAAGYLLRNMVSDGAMDVLGRTYNSASFQRAIHWIVGAALTGSTSQEAAYAESQNRAVEPPRGELQVA